MMNAVENTLPKFGIAKERIHTERFHTGQARKRSVEADANRKEEKVNIILDGRELIVSVAQDDESILDAALRAGADLPYACKGGCARPVAVRYFQAKSTCSLTIVLKKMKLKRAMC